MTLGDQDFLSLTDFSHSLNQNSTATNTSEGLRALSLFTYLWMTEGVLRVTTSNTFTSLKRDFSVNTDLWISTVPQGREQSKWASQYMEQVSKASVMKQSTVEQVSGVSGVSVASKQT